MKLKGTVSRDWGGLEVAWVNRPNFGEVPLVVYYFFYCPINLQFKYLCSQRHCRMLVDRHSSSGDRM